MQECWLYARLIHLQEKIEWSLPFKPQSDKSSVTEGKAHDLLKAEMPVVRHIEKELIDNGYQKGTDEYKKMFDSSLAFYRKFGNVDLN